MINQMLVSHPMDLSTKFPKDRWDFSKPRRHILDAYGSITREVILQWGCDCVNFPASDYKVQDQTWLQILARASCEPDLRRKVDM